MKWSLWRKPETQHTNRNKQRDYSFRRSRDFQLGGKLVRIILWIALATLLIQFLPNQVDAAITLASFTATYSPSQILVEWETATEIDTVGFYLQRSLQATSGFQRITEFIPAEGESVFGWFYNFIDTNIAEGTTYYYVLEVINVDNTSENYGPISVYAGSDTLTPTATSSPTATRTFTPTGSTPTPTRTPTRTPSRTPTRTPTRSLTPYRTQVPTNTFVPTFTLTETPSPTFTATITPTLTLASLPTLVYTLEPTSTETPTITPVPSETPSPTPVVEAQVQESFLMRAIRSGALARIALVVSVIAFWIILALGIYIFIQHRLR